MSDPTATTATPPHSTAPYDLDVSVANGKYRVRARNGCDLHALRHGQLWRDLVGDGLVLALATELAEARDRLITVHARLAGEQIGALDTAKMREEEADWTNDEVATLRVQVAALERENALLKAGMPLPEITIYTTTGSNLTVQHATECDALRDVLRDISTTAHCLAMSGPASTPILADAWSAFMRIDAMATNGLSLAKGQQ